MGEKEDDGAAEDARQEANEFVGVSADDTVIIGEGVAAKMENLLEVVAIQEVAAVEVLAGEGHVFEVPVLQAVDFEHFDKEFAVGGAAGFAAAQVVDVMF